MSSPYVGEIRLFGFNFAPLSWAFCNGQTLPISQNAALYNLIGTTYGGDGVMTFSLPDLRNRVPVHQGNGFAPGQSGGSPTVSLTAANLPSHTHGAQYSTGPGSATSPSGALFAGTAPGWRVQYYANGVTPAATMAPAMVQTAGQGAPLSIFAPYLALNYCISLYGIYPSQN